MYMEVMRLSYLVVAKSISFWLTTVGITDAYNAFLPGRNNPANHFLLNDLWWYPTRNHGEKKGVRQ